MYKCRVCHKTFSSMGDTVLHEIDAHPNVKTAPKLLEKQKTSAEEKLIAGMSWGAIIAFPLIIAFYWYMVNKAKGK